MDRCEKAGLAGLFVVKIWRPRRLDGRSGAAQK
jgi:hypothetical protein